MSSISRFILPLVLTGWLCSCESASSWRSNQEKINIHGVITYKGEPANNYSVALHGVQTQTDGGYYQFEDVQSGPSRIYIRRGKSSKPRYHPKVLLTESDSVLNFEIVPYYAADHGPFQYDWRLHRSWGNALDDPFDTASFNGLMENTHTLSGLLLKPVYVTAVIGDFVWTVPGAIIGFVGARHTTGEFSASRFSIVLLAGYLSIETIVKAIEIPVKTIFWPIDRLVAMRSRSQLKRLRSNILDQHQTNLLADDSAREAQ